MLIPRTPALAAGPRRAEDGESGRARAWAGAAGAESARVGVRRSPSCPAAGPGAARSPSRSSRRAIGRSRRLPARSAADSARHGHGAAGQTLRPVSSPSAVLLGPQSSPNSRPHGCPAGRAPPPPLWVTRWTRDVDPCSRPRDWWSAACDLRAAEVVGRESGTGLPAGPSQRGAQRGGSWPQTQRATSQGCHPQTCLQGQPVACLGRAPVSGRRCASSWGRGRSPPSVSSALFPGFL